MLKIVENNESQNENRTDLDALARAGAQQMLQAALEAEVAEYLARSADERDEDGHAKVVRNGHGPARKVMCGAGTLDVRRPRVNDKRIDESGKRKRFSSSILPPYMRRSPKVAEVLCCSPRLNRTARKELKDEKRDENTNRKGRVKRPATVHA